MKTLHLNILIDGLGFEILKELDLKAIDHNNIRPLDTVFGFSSSAIPTILTGKTPEEHGYWNLFYRDKEKSDFPLFKYYNYIPKVLQNRVTRKLTLMANKHISRFKGYYQAYDFPSDKLSQIRISEKDNIYSPNGIEGSYSLIDKLYDEVDPSNFVSYSYKDNLNDFGILERIENDILSRELNIAFAYLCEYDAFGHKNATDKHKMINEAQRYINRIVKLVNRAATKYDEIKLDVFSDHGMVPFDHGFDIIGLLNRSWNSWETDVFSCIDSTLARFYGDQESIQRIKSILENQEGRWLTEADLEMYSIRFDGKYGNAFYLLPPGSQFVPSHMGRVHCNGMHGYDPKDPDMLASHLTNYVHSKPVHHIKDLFEHLSFEWENINPK